jgi:hypothetical protein
MSVVKLPKAFFRRRLQRVEPSTPTPPPPAALQVIGVENVFYDEPLLTFTLVFNTTAEQPLVVDAPDPAKWSAVYQGGGFFCESVAFAAFDRLDVQMNGTPGPGGASSVSYSNDPSDVADSLGRQLAAFSDFPLE